jgi:hypothetical protein
MSDKCSHCGSELFEEREGMKFCAVCGEKIEEQLQSTPVIQDEKQENTPEVQDEQQVTQESQPQTDLQPERTGEPQIEPPIPAEPQPSSPQKPEKPQDMPSPPSMKQNRFAIFGIVTVVVAVAVGAIILVSLFSGSSPTKSIDTRFVGEWEQNTIQGALLWTFKNDSSLETTSPEGITTNIGAWNVNGSQLWLYNDLVCYSYAFSTDGTTLSLTVVGESYGHPTQIILLKEGQQQINPSPDIDCEVDSSFNRIQVTFTNPNTKWRDIRITTSPPADWQIFSATGAPLAKINITSTIITDVAAGDYIIFLNTNGNVEVTFEYVPTQVLLGTWTVNI